MTIIASTASTTSVLIDIYRFIVWVRMGCIGNIPWYNGCMVTKLQTEARESTAERLERLKTENFPPAAQIDLSGLSDDDLKREAKESLVLMMRSAKGDLRALGAVRELLDRLEGKPIARTEASLDVRQVSVEVKAHQIRNEQIAKILGLGKTPAP